MPAVRHKNILVLMLGQFGQLSAANKFVFYFLQTEEKDM